jgi:hypothetical protein
MRSRAFDERFIADACTFINELFDSDDANLDDWVHVSVLESLAGDVTVQGRLSNLF